MKCAATTCFAAILTLACPAALFALPTEVIEDDVDHCDPLIVPDKVDELGIAPAFVDFPDELIEAVSTFTERSACPASDNPELPNVIVDMKNLTPTPWAQVWYVADPLVTIDVPMGTSISNYDGFVDGAPFRGPAGLAFRIDFTGVNKPLIFESITPDGIFEPGETWQFIIDDYVNTAGIAPHVFDSLGVGGVSLGGPPSSGSIIAQPVPEPSSVVLALLGVAALAFTAVRRRANR